MDSKRFTKNDTSGIVFTVMGDFPLNYFLAIYLLICTFVNKLQIMITNTSTEKIKELLHKQRAYFRSHQTLDIAFRLRALKRLRDAIKMYEVELLEALYKDLHKSPEEAFLTEISIVLGEIDNFLKNLPRWAAPSKKSTPITLFPSRSEVVTEPLGVALIIAPWNYPVQLLLNPLVGAISSGCTAVLKPSPYVPHVSLAIEEMIKETFEEQSIFTDRV